MNNREHIMNPWVNASVLKIKKWTDNLFSLFLKAPILPFQAGQFTRIALPNDTTNDNTTQKMIQRAYSYVNAPSEKILEIYIARVIHGKLSNALYNLTSGDTILIKKKSMGFFTMQEIPSAQILWMLATGTAIGPYCSILQESSHDLNRFEHIILVHAVRYQNELTYFPLMQELQKKYNGKLKIQSIVSREKHANSLTGRIPLLLKERVLEKKIGFSITPNNSHVMLCGNPEMVKDACIVLKNRNMNKHLRRKYGHITTENYW